VTLPLTDRIVQPSQTPAVSLHGSAQPDDEFAAAMRDFYAEVDASIAAHQPVCINRGDCCKFAAYGHRLYVTDVELAYFIRGEPARPVDSAAGACPYQEAGRCTARGHRPLGCRVFFCDENAREWQGPEYERHLERLKEIGRRFDISYRYREWLSALAGGLEKEVGPTSPPAY
jgi:Fe-S-cluster containining protein